MRLQINTCSVWWAEVKEYLVEDPGVGERIMLEWMLSNTE
jgi:hypothetical protein